MRDYLRKVLELTKPYRFRFALGLLCGVLSGASASTLLISVKLAIDTVFPAKTDEASASLPGSYLMLPNLVVSTNSPVLSLAGQTNFDGGVLHGAVLSYPGQAAIGDYTISVGQQNQALSQTYTGIFTVSPSFIQGGAAGANTPPASGSSGMAKTRDKGQGGLPAPVKAIVGKIGSWFRPGDHPSATRKVVVISLIPLSMFVRGLLAYLNIYMLSWVGIRAANDLKVKLFTHLVNLPMGFFNKHSTGDLMARLDGAMAVSNTINTSFATVIREPVTILGMVIALIATLWGKPLLSVLTLMVFPVCLVPVIIYGRKLRKSHSGIYAKFASVANVMHEAFTGMRVIKGYNLESTVVGEFRRAIEAVTGFFMRSVRASEVPGPLIEFIGAVGVALIFAYFAFVAPDGAGFSNMLVFFMAIFQMYAPLKNLSRLHSQLTLARASLDPVYELLAIQTTLPEPAQPKPLQAHGAAIRFEKVNFSYGDKPVLHDINLTIRPGQLVALVGYTGSGKTSIANLLLRFYDPQAGAILIGDTDIRFVSSRDLRANIAVVTQQTILFNDTIRHNIALGRPGATNAEIEEAARHACAHEFIKDKPHGYETNVGEKGGNLSGGQQQRIAIARAILKNAPILILDEATNSLDPKTEKIVQTALEALMENRTTICIAHRLSTIQKADLIIVLDNGRIVETGTHAELLQKGGIYSKLYKLSFESPTT